MLESKRKAIIFFVISLLLALTSGFLVLKKVKALNNNLGTMVQIFVANEDIPSRALIRPEDIKMEEIPQKYLRDYHITNAEELMNKVSIVPLSTGDIITKNMLKQASSVVEENNRLITLMQADRIFFDEPLEAMDRVDIIVSHRFNSKEETSVFMKDVKVARVAKEKNKFKGVQLEVPLEAAPELIHMQNYADSVRIVKANVGKLESMQLEDTDQKAPGEKIIEEKADIENQEMDANQQPAKSKTKDAEKSTKEEVTKEEKTKEKQKPDPKQKKQGN
ncbi:Flp pilus assembly protein CpaB [Lederbergia citrea]|uniref:Flagella basal body P-ring formation protein FlgA n=1 Tax=Lederbergia citrea TaxID=2833581 RepID=A0A942Z6W3_9BACI|nr:flagella basal body P-ring formation protein FlgA [Lederbergia citrea]MBS4179502.1 flagella basal body P-ring formation protein FlgA [Lederbergia citrea]MBS4224895.1 flagella basal body P-ring formation protein FlgA [Lederbergia citrea]